MPRGNEVDRSSHVVGVLLKRHSVVDPGCDAGSTRMNAATRFDESWLMFTVCPAMVRLPDRFAPLFGATDTVTVPLPLPVEPEVTVINVAFETAVQVQLEVTENVSVAPVEGATAVSGETVPTHGPGPAPTTIVTSFDGSVSTGSFRFIDVWTRRHDRWVAVSSQDTVIPD